MAFLCSKAVGVSNDTVIFAEPGIAYKQNIGLDSDHVGKVTKTEASVPVIRRLKKGLSDEYAG